MVSLRWLVCTRGAFRYALSARHLLGVVGAPLVVSVPKTKSPFLGLLGFRGEVVPVIEPFPDEISPTKHRGVSVSDEKRPVVSVPPPAVVAVMATEHGEIALALDQIHDWSSEQVINDVQTVSSLDIERWTGFVREYLDGVFTGKATMTSSQVQHKAGG